MASNVQTNPKVDLFLSKTKRWRTELDALRNLLLSSELTEDLKWGKPCYTLNGANVALLYEFKESAAIGFLKGALLPDPAGILVAPGENSQSMRMVKVTDPQQIATLAPVLKDYLAQAIAVEKAGLSVEFQKSAPAEMPAEFQQRLEDTPGLKAAFEALTPGRQRAYLLHFGAAKQSQTRAARVEKCIPDILSGKGLND
ncbi:MAG TPA: YdeI/OmpD-associated family protein [Candidatus Limiplasma sp.]|nr:YdeI/OmpD-associated family protein [Candidatus Limiplasma sp.]HPS81893.1 YdeI/OmpD-associated family protein [Candidatus Limiplasma sp.]